MPSTVLDDIAIEADKLEQELSRVQSFLRGWTRGNETNPSFEFMKADQARFFYPPTESARWRLTSAQAITNNTWNTLVWDEETWNFGPLEYSTASTGIFRFRKKSDKVGLLLTGFIRWPDNSSGERLLRFNVLTTSGQISRKISDPRAANLGQNEPYIFVYHVLPDSSGFNFQVWQNGEAPSLNVAFAYLGVVPIAKWEETDSTKILVISPPTQDAYVLGDSSGGSLDNNPSPSSYIVTADSSSGGGGQRHFRSFLQFDLSGIPADKDILSADLEMLVSSRENNSSFNGAVDIQRVTTAWLSSVITGANQPPVSGSMGSTGENGASTWAGWTLSTAEFKNMMSSNFGMRVAYTDETAQGSTNPDTHNFYGAAAEPFFDRRPRLVVRYLEA